MLKTTTLFLALLLSSITSFAYTGEGSGPTGEQTQQRATTAVTPAELSLSPTSATSQLTPVEHTAPVSTPNVQAATPQPEGSTDSRAADLRIGKRAGGVFAGVKEWFSNRSIFKKREAIASDSGMNLGGWARTGVILMLVGLIVLLVGILLPGGVGDVFYVVGGILMVVGLILFLLGLLDVLI